MARYPAGRPKPIARNKVQFLLPLLGCLLVLVALSQFYLSGTTLNSSNPASTLAAPTKSNTSPEERQKGRTGSRAQLEEQSPAQRDPLICFVIRTYFAHGIGQPGQLRSMLDYLAQNQYKSWEALLLVLDSKPFKSLGSIVQSYNDKRIRVAMEEIKPEYRAKNADGTWNGVYHDYLYNATDAVIRACPKDTQWVVVTNADNEYDPDFITQVGKTPPSVGIIAFDFYSRFQRPTAAPCHRFASSPGAPPCKENKLRFCSTDLAANVFNWPRFMREGRGFMDVPSLQLGLNDGYLAQALLQDGWPVLHVRERCLVSHSPNPQQCALQGGVWDDTNFDSFSGSGGDCLGREDAGRLMRNPKLETVVVPIANDGSSFGYGAASKAGPGPVKLTCVRKPIPGGVWQNVFFPDDCAATIDGGRHD